MAPRKSAPKQPITESSPESSPASSTGSTIHVAPRRKTNEEREREASPSPSNVKKGKQRGRKVRFAEPSEDQRERDPSSAPSKANAQKGRARKTVPVRFKKKDEQQRERHPNPAPSGEKNEERHQSESTSDSSIDADEVVCDCADKPENGRIASPKPKDYFICCRCAYLQHYKCHKWDLGEQTGPEHFRCNTCADLEVKGMDHLIQTREESMEAWREAQNAKLEELEEKLMRMFWRSYCMLPGSDAPAKVHRACETIDSGGKSIPMNAAPQSWVQMLKQNLEYFEEAAGMKVTDFATKPEYYRKDLSMTVIEPLGEMARHLINRGQYKGRRDLLGLIAELVGIEPKGTYWKG